MPRSLRRGRRRAARPSYTEPRPGVRPALTLRPEELEAKRADMAAYDALPAYIRLVVRQSANPVDCRPLLEIWNSFRFTGVHQDVLESWPRLMVQRDHDLLAQFAMAYQLRQGRPYPHIAARATILRSEDVPWGGTY